MLVTFKTKAYPNITMFGDVAVRLLKMMGHSGTVPSAILAADVPAALERLKAAIAEEKKRAAAASPPAAERDEDREEPPIGLPTRAVPLIELLEAAAERGADVMWDS
ncbi:MAG: DUF1840 domain-containing protein [Gammaproteobacteria bacterium]|nr:DUF1840 domain-containing protein [Gammaproteobacteria bacterium]